MTQFQHQPTLNFSSNHTKKYSKVIIEAKLGINQKVKKSAKCIYMLLKQNMLCFFTWTLVVSKSKLCVCVWLKDRIRGWPRWL